MKKALVRIIKDWSSPDILRQTPAGSGFWGDIEFTCDPIEECDYVIILNRITERVKVFCPPGNIWAVMQEPYIKGVHDWLIEGHSQFSRVYTHHFFSRRKKYRKSQPFLPWHVNKNFDFLNSQDLFHKSYGISCIASNKSAFPGHQARLDFVEQLKDSQLDIDFFGKGINEIGDKADGLDSYKYSIAIENSSSSDYWTEKISDCFLCYTMPIYHGCKNIDDYFPNEAVIKININDPSEAIAIIEDAVKENRWKKNLDAIVESRKSILNDLQFFPAMAKEIQNDFAYNPKDKSKFKKITLEVPKRNLLNRLIRKFI